MLRTLALTAAALSIATGAPAFAAACKDAHGKFIKCPQKPAAPKRCKTAKGAFAKCGTPGARPV